MAERRVRTPEGAKYFGLPIGAVITPEAMAAVRARNAVKAAKPGKAEDIKPVPVQKPTKANTANTRANAIARNKAAQFEIRQKNPGEPYDVIHRDPKTGAVTIKAKGLSRNAARAELRRWQRGAKNIRNHPDDSARNWRNKGWNGMKY